MQKKIVHVFLHGFKHVFLHVFLLHVTARLIINLTSCGACVSHKGALHRAVVQELTPGTAQCRVAFIDYGDVATVEQSELRPLSDACAGALPAQAVLCGLVGQSGEQGPRHFAALLKACGGIAPQYIKVGETVFYLNAINTQTYCNNKSSASCIARPSTTIAVLLIS